MANNDNYELSKAVKDAVKIMESAFGNKAQTKAKQQKEMMVLEQWFKTQRNMDQALKELKEAAEFQQEVAEVDKFHKERQTSKFLEGVKHWWKTTSEQRTKLGATLRVTSAIWKSTSEYIVGRFKDAFGWLKGHLQDVLGPLMDVFVGLKNLVMGPFKAVFGLVKLIRGEKAPPHDKYRNELLEDMNKMMSDQIKADQREVKGKKKIDFKSLLLTILAGLAFAAGAAIGAGVKKLLIPFELAWKAISSSRIGKGFTRFVNWIKGFKLWSKIDDFIKAIKKNPFMAKIGGWITSIGKLGGSSKILTGLLKGLKFGFKVLGWPLTIILGVIDFVKGFTATEGTLFDKIKGGLMSALDGLIELPVKLIGWAVEKLLGLFGVEVDGIGDKMMDWIHKGFDLILDFNPFKPLVDFIEGFWGAEGTFMEKVKAGFNSLLEGLIKNFAKWGVPIYNAVYPIIEGVINFFKDIWNGIVDGMIAIIPDWVKDYVPGVEGKVEALRGMKLEETKLSPIQVMTDVEKDKIKVSAEQREEERKFIDAASKAYEKNERQNQATQNAVNQLAVNQSNQGSGDFRQTPDEVDNSAITFKNMALDFGD